MAKKPAKTKKTSSDIKTDAPFYQQGDVLLFKVNKIPANLKERKDQTVAFGEVTGHSHRMKGKAKVFNKNKDTFVDVSEPSNIEHEEHKPIKIPKGKYKIKIVKERNHFLNVTQYVRD